MANVSCTIRLLCLQPGVTPHALIEHLASHSTGSPAYIFKGQVHGWIHRPHHHDKQYLLAHDWDVFLLTRQSTISSINSDVVSGQLSVKVAVPHQQLEEIEAQRNDVPRPMPDTPPLPDKWPREGGIPESVISQGTRDPLKAGELRLDRQMVDFLSTALPIKVANAPVSLMNFFRYPAGDSSIHDAYMEGFEHSFGNAAGARVKFMGPVESAIEYSAGDSGTSETDLICPVESKLWQDANLVQYDSIWHYAHMLSTDVYAELNRQKVAGLEDTCILCVSEVELAR